MNVLFILQVQKCPLQEPDVFSVPTSLILGVNIFFKFPKIHINLLTNKVFGYKGDKSKMTIYRAIT